MTFDAFDLETQRKSLIQSRQFIEKYWNIYLASLWDLCGAAWWEPVTFDQSEQGGIF